MNNYFKYIGLIVLVICSTLFSQSNKNTNVGKDSSLIITIASEPDYPPYCFVDENGNADGFAVDLFKATADAVGIKLNTKIGVWNKIKNDLTIGEIDALPLVGRTPEREFFYDFTMPYLSLHDAIFTDKKTKDILSLKDLKNKSIAVMKGDNAEEFILRENISDNIITTHTFEEAFHLLENGQCDAVITQRITGIKLLEIMGIKNIKPLNLLLPQFKQDFCFAVKKGNNDLLNKLNEGLSIIIANNTFKEIHVKWFGPKIKEELAIEDIIKIGIYIFIPLFVLMLLISVIYLRSKVRKRTKYLQEDVSDHKKILDKLRLQKDLFSNSEEQIRLLLNSTAEGIYGIDINGNCTFCNKAALKMLKINDEKELICKNMPSFIHSKQKDGSLFPIEDCKIYKAFLNSEYTHIRNEVFWRLDDSNFDVEYFSYPIKQNDKIIGAVVTFWDITNEKRIINELQETKEYLENLINYANTPIIVWNKELKIKRFNRAFEKLTGLKFDEVIGEHIEILFPEETKEESLKLINSTIEGKHWETLEIEIQNTNGSIKNVLWNSANIYNSDKVLIAIIAQGNDITERKIAENELRKIENNLEIEVEKQTADLKEKIKRTDKSQKAMLYMVEDLNDVTKELKDERGKLQLSNNELEAFSYSVSHDLRAPLRAIDGFSKFLEEDFSDKLEDEAKRLIKVIRQNTKKMDQLISDMLNLSRFSRTEINYSNINMTKMVQSIFDEIVSDEDKKAFEFIVKPLSEISADSTLLKQVWINLIGNAIKYSQKSKTKKIIISAEDKKDFISYKIQDFGAGFDEKYVSKLFGVFQRLHTEKEFEGSGVGLAIVKRIIHSHGGEVGANSELNNGATFYFTLPK